MGKIALLFDTETTGLPVFDRRADQEGQPRLCSIAAELIDMETRQTIAHMHRLCDGSSFSHGDWNRAQEPKGAFEYNGLTASLMLAEGVPIEIIIDEFKTLEDQCDGYVAFSADFDLKVLRGERRRHGRDDRFNFKPYFDPKWEMGKLIGGRAGPSQLRLYEGLFGEKPPERDKSKARQDVSDMRRIFLHALDHCQPLQWKFLKAKEKFALEDTPKPAAMDAAS